jgi:L-alanine-DL-glutamate epimerase-like enolase superfamily enzyme
MDDEGMVHVPRRPGIGVDVDVEMIDDLTVRREELRATPAMVTVA